MARNYENYTGGQKLFVRKQKFGIECLNGHTIIILSGSSLKIFSVSDIYKSEL